VIGLIYPTVPLFSSVLKKAPGTRSSEVIWKRQPPITEEEPRWSFHREYQIEALFAQGRREAQQLRRRFDRLRPLLPR